MATQLGNPLADPVSRAGDRLLRAIIHRTDSDLRRRQLDLTERQVEIGEADASARRRGEAFDRFLKVGELLLPGESFQDRPGLIPIARQAFPELSEDDFLAAISLPMSNKTLRDAIEERSQEILADLGPDDPLWERIANHAAFGEAKTNAQLQGEELRSELGAIQSQLVMDGLEVAMRDEEFIKNATRIAMGLEETFSIPGFEHEFITSDQARVWAQLLMHTDMFSLRMRELEADAVKDIAGEVMDMANRMEIQIGRPAAEEIVRAYGMSASGDFPEGETPLDALYASANEERKRVIRAFIGGIDIAAEAWMSQYPQMQDFWNFSEALSNRFDQSEVKAIMEDLGRQGLIPGFGVGRAPRVFTPRFQFSPTPQGFELGEDALRDIGIALAEGFSAEQVSNAVGRPLSPEELRRARELVNRTLEPVNVDALEGAGHEERGEGRTDVSISGTRQSDISRRAEQGASPTSFEEFATEAEELLPRNMRQQAGGLRALSARPEIDPDNKHKERLRTNILNSIRRQVERNELLLESMRNRPAGGQSAPQMARIEERIRQLKDFLGRHGG